MDDGVDYDDDGFERSYGRRDPMDAKRFAEAGHEVVSVLPEDMCSEADRRQAMRVLAEEGSAKKAVARLWSEHHISLAEKDLIRWRDTKFPKLWVEVSTEYQVELERNLEATTRANAAQAAKASSVLIERIVDQVDQADGVEAAKMLDSLTKAGQAGTNQMLQVSGRPVDGKAFSLDESLRTLERLLRPAIEGTAEEIVEEADAVEEGAS